MEHTDSWKRIPGANIDEEALLKPGNVKIRYRDRAIQYITAKQTDQNVDIEVQFCNGKSLFWSTANVDVTFSMLWGIPLSFDCKYIFAPQVNGGVWCLSVENGSVKWKSKSRANFKQIMVNTTGSICCASGEHNIVVLDIATGVEKAKRRISVNNHFTVLGKHKLLVEATSAKWYVLDSETLDIIEIISKKDLNSYRGQEIWKRIFEDWGR